VHYSVLLCLAAGFWIVRSQGLIYGYYSLFNLGRYPDVIFRGLFKFVFSWVIPIILVTNVPARLLIRAGDAPGPLILQLLLATLIATGATRLFWLTALRRYASASSCSLQGSTDAWPRRFRLTYRMLEGDAGEHFNGLRL
jgi:ABC-2 type transport system permease protein